MSRDATYSRIIEPEEFNRINTDQHLYIRASDRVIKKLVAERNPREVVEFGCGPARFLRTLEDIEGINLTGVDHDQDYIEFAEIIEVKPTTLLVVGDVETYRHPRKIDVVVTQGAHHHFSKPPIYLENVVNQLSEGGVYILSDEFLPEYKSEDERRVRAVIWYSHIIANALEKNNIPALALAFEEVKTLLDELNTTIDETRIKTPQQMKLVFASVKEISEKARAKKIRDAEKLAERFLAKLEKIYNWRENDDQTLNLSRGDYKICERVLLEEIEPYGLEVERKKSIGPIKSIGAMSVYVLRRRE